MTYKTQEQERNHLINSLYVSFRSAFFNIPSSKPAKNLAMVNMEASSEVRPYSPPSNWRALQKVDASAK